ncbi:unnamed protein product, partial [Discosporangium mesarthrocarpum]
MSAPVSFPVGDPAASSLSTCMRPFPGGVSLITESGLLRPFLVGAGSEVVTALEPVALGKEGPVDHAWSNDGKVLVILFRSKLSVLTRDGFSRTSKGVQDHRDIAGLRRSGKAPVRVMNLTVVESTTPPFEGKTTACCGLEAQGGNSRRYLVAMGGSFGVECYFLEIAPERGQADPWKDGEVGCSRDSLGDSECESQAPCGCLSRAPSLFVGYPVVALAFSPDSKLFAAAAMTGHVRIWDVGAAVCASYWADCSRESQKKGSKSTSLKARSSRPRNSRERDRASGLRLDSGETRTGQAAEAGPGALWSVTLSTPRVISISFCTGDKPSFALSCWDGQTLLFHPCKEQRLRSPSPQDGHPTSSGEHAGNEVYRSKEAGKEAMSLASKTPGPRSWQQAHLGGDFGRRFGESSGESLSSPDKLEDRDGHFLCWLLPGLQGEAADLAITSLRVAGGPTTWAVMEGVGGGHRAWGAEQGTWGPPTWTRHRGSSLLGHSSGVEVYGSGNGERLCGLATGPGAEVAQPAARRYLVHGLACGAGFLALYDSDCNLHVAQRECLATVIGRDSLSQTHPCLGMLVNGHVSHRGMPPPPDQSSSNTANREGGFGGNGEPRNPMSLSGDCEGGRAQRLSGKEMKSSPPSTPARRGSRRGAACQGPPLGGKTTLVDNAHGKVLILGSWGQGPHREGFEDGAIPSVPQVSSCGRTRLHPTREDLSISVVWRDPDVGKEEKEEEEEEGLEGPGGWSEEMESLPRT